jgi:hypothetical protein
MIAGPADFRQIVTPAAPTRIHFMKRVALVCATALAVSCSGGSDAPQTSGVNVVPHEKLLEFLPALDGWTKRSEPQGTTDTAERVSRVQVDYDPSGADKSSALSIEIMDTAMNPHILAPLKEFIKANREQKSGDREVIVTATPVEVAGFRGQQEWTPSVHNGTLSLLLADRFTVGITANAISGPEVMRQVAQAMDLKKLASLK